MAREDNSMSRSELEAFVSSAEWMVLGVLDQAGGPQGALVPARVSGGLLHFAVPPGSATEESLLRDPRCCCTIDVFPSYYEIKGATVHGSARRVDDADIAEELAARAVRHGLSGGSVYAIPLHEDCVGFDFAKLERR
jgi:hypothetical protein